MIAWLIRAACRGKAPTPEPLPPDVEVRYAGWLPSLAGVLSGFGGPAAAVTLGRTIVVHPSVPITPELVRHELAHVRQWQENRWTFPVRYVVNHFRYGYHDNPFEVAARAAEPNSRRGGQLSNSVVTIERHIIEQERQHPEATGAFSNLLYDIALAAKLIAREVRSAGLVDILGGTDERNVSGDQVQKLDLWAHEAMFKALDHTGHLCCMASEESETYLPIPAEFPTGDYALIYDPLDGSSNIDANVSIGTIFSIHRKISDGARGCEKDCVQPGNRQVAAGYILYGSATMLVYTTGQGVHGFTLDPSIGEFLLSHPNIRLPSNPQRIYSVNEGNYALWSAGQRQFIDYLKAVDEPVRKPFSARYIGSLVADFHRTLLYGGIFMYPADRKNPSGKLRVCYEAAPLAFLAEQAGGRASDGHRNVLDIEPRSLHDRTALYTGSKEFVDLAETFLKQDAEIELTV